jgi:DNA mismatch endonuclease (patch repair protein)
VVFPRQRIAIFVDGCFWHGCPEHGVRPRTNSSYWRPKIARNRARDNETTEALETHGWLVIRVWEHEALTDAVERIAAAINRRSG